MPQLVSIRLSPRFPSKALLSFSNQSTLPLDLKNLKQFNFKTGQKINPVLFSGLCLLSFTPLLQNYALRQIAISAKSQKEITLKLARFLSQLVRKHQVKNFTKSDLLISQTIAFLNQKKFLQPTDFVDAVIRKHPYKSASYLRRFLIHHQIDPNLLPPQTVSPDCQKQIIKNIIKKKYQKYDLSDFKQKNKVISALYRRAFSYSDIKLAIDDLLNFS